MNQSSAITLPKPAILSVTKHGDCLHVVGRYCCGHDREVAFPGCTKRPGQRELREWVFGFNGDEVCSGCRQGKAS